MKTDMGNTGARHFGAKEASVEVQDSADFVIAQVRCSLPSFLGFWPECLFAYLTRVRSTVPRGRKRLGLGRP